MPEQPPGKRKPQIRPLAAHAHSPPPAADHRYAELHCKTNFSFLEGASHAEELVARAVELGYSALAITDRNSLAGVVRAHTAAKDSHMKLLIGAEITPTDAPPLVLLATDRAAYGRLARLITRGRRRAPKGECELALADVAEHSDGLLAAILPIDSTTPPASSSGDSTREFSSPVLAPVALLQTYRDIFGDRSYLLAELHRGPHDQRLLQQLVDLSCQSQIPLVAAGDVHFHVPERMVLQHLLTAIRHGVTVEQAGELLFANAQRHLRSIDDIVSIYTDIPAAVRRTLEVAQRCHFSLDELRYEYPEELAPEGETPIEFLRRLTWRGAQKRYPQEVPERVRKLLEHELELIADLRYEAYFLTVWDLVRFARQQGILCQGRGSAANSAVCYCLGVTSVDPDRVDLLFERFVSRERNEAPDIDVDFEHERREEVLQYIYEKYGRERAGMTAEVITYRSRSAIRDVGKALGFSLDRVDALAKTVEGYTQEPNLATHCRTVGIDPDSKTGKQLVGLVNQLIGFPRHLSQHVGGMVMTQGPLNELVPIENAAMPDRTVIQWDKDDLDELGILKVDCLALGMLTAIHKCFDFIAQHYGRQLTLANIPAEDPGVYDMICQADTMGVFQIESRAQMSMLPRLRPRCFYDLVIEVAIVRPGPIQGDMVHPYLRRRNGEEEETYPDDAIRQVLHKTLGVPIFQEQAMRLAVVAAGFTPGQADQLRRAMGAWRKPGLIDNFRIKLIDGMLARGLKQDFAEKVFRQIRGFGEYGFPESHAASFALLVYVSAWLKCYYPEVFTAGLINSQPMGFYAPSQLLRDAREHNVPVLPVDVNRSNWDCTLEPAGPLAKEDCEPTGDEDRDPKKEQTRIALRLGLRMISGLSHRHAVVIEQQRQSGGSFRSIDEFTRRTQLARAAIARLADADAFHSLHDRRNALWHALAQDNTMAGRSLFDGLPSEEEADFQLPPLSPQQEVYADYQTTGLSLRNHPVAFYRNELNQLNVQAAAQLSEIPNNRNVRVAGLVILRQRPSTAKGITFVTLEDETGIANLVLHTHIWQRYYQIARRSQAWIAHGRLECKDSVIHVVVRRLEDMSSRLAELTIKSRDFR